MAELKTFGELSLQDRYYCFCKSNGNSFVMLPESLAPSENKKNHISIKDDSGEITDLPCDETFYEDECFIFSTDKKDYNKWQIPHWEKEIKALERRMGECYSEIDILQEKIRKAT